MILSSNSQPEREQAYFPKLFIRISDIQHLIANGATTFTSSIFTLLSMCACFCPFLTISQCHGLLIVLFVSVVLSQSDITLTREEDLNHGLNLVFYPVFWSLTHPVCGIRVIALGISLHLTKDGLSV